MKKIILLLITFAATFMRVQSQTIIPLYPDNDIPNSKPSPDKESREQKDILIISAVSKPTLEIYLPEKATANGTAVVIVPGGGYSIVAYSHEGTDVAKEFNKMGVAAFVLKYRIPNDATMIDKEIGPLQDAQQAIKTVRDHAKQWNINPQSVGIMGFSAGGHLASTAGTHFIKAVIDNKENTNLRPDFMMLIYPVISFTDSIAHIGSRDNLIGKNPSQEKIIEYSNELQVTDKTPPTFLVHASDDNAVNPLNSVAFYDALIKHHVPAELHIYEKGGHGFGMHNRTTNDLWMERCKNWLISNEWFNPSNKK